MSLGRLTDTSLRSFGVYPLLVHEGRRITNDELHRRAAALGASLADLGLEPGRTIALLLPNSPEMIVSYLGIWRAGCVAVPLLPQSTTSEVAARLAACRAS